MGFKMKGSAFKLGTVQGTSGHASALKDRPKRGPEYSDNVNSKIQAHNDQHSANPDMVHDQGEMLDGDQTWWNVKDKRPRKAKMETKYKNPDGSPKKDDQGNPLVDPNEKTPPLEMKSALKQKVVELDDQSTITYDHDKLDDKYLPAHSGQIEVNRKGNMFKKRKGSHGSSGGEVAWMRDTYGPRFLQNASKKELRNARMEYFDLMQGSSSNKSNTEESTTEKPMTKAIHETGEDTRSELNKSLRKGYFNKGEGSEYIATRPRPEDFGTFEEYQAALRKHEMDYPNVNHESP